jgi:hypothetical protein
MERLFRGLLEEKAHAQASGRPRFFKAALERPPGRTGLLDFAETKAGPHLGARLDLA